MNEPLLLAENLTKAFGAKNASPVLRGVNLTLSEGDFTVVMGASGAGKSTLLYALSGMDAVDSGTLHFKGQDLRRCSERQMAALRADAFGFVFQQTHLVGNLTLRENILLAGFLSSRQTERQTTSRADLLIETMNLQKAQNRLPAAVSGGEAQRAAVARAVIAQPDILFADEPTGALNKANSREVMELLSALHQNGQTVLLVTHDKNAALYGKTILYMEDGRIISELSLSPYAGADARREARLTAWLGRLGW